MEFIEVAIPGDKAYALPIGDIHYGEAGFTGKGQAKLKGNLDWLRERETHAFGVFMGDIFNIAGRDSKTSPFGSNSREIIEAVDFFMPYRDLFKGGIGGNHEFRVENQYGFNPMELFCKFLEIPYLGNLAVVKVQVGQRPNTPWYNQTYYMAIHHTSTGGRTLGSALNGVEQLSKVVGGCDVYAGGHNHQLISGVRSTYLPTPFGLKELKQHYVSCGSYLDFEGSYAEQKPYAPGKLGSPRIRFGGERDHHDVHISI